MITMEDPIIHTQEHPICDDDPTCPCREALQVGTKVLIEVEIRGFFDDSMMVAGGWMPLNRIKAIVEPEQEEQDEDPEDDMEERLARQAEQHLSDRGYFDMWGLHEDDEPWYLSSPNQSDWLVE